LPLSLLLHLFDNVSSLLRIQLEALRFLLSIHERLLPGWPSKYVDRAEDLPSEVLLKLVLVNQFVHFIVDPIDVIQFSVSLLLQEVGPTENPIEQDEDRGILVISSD